MPRHDPTFDDQMTETLRTFAQAVVGERVSVTFEAGVASIRGAVASATQARALEDLIAAHDGVERVTCDLQIVPAATPRARALN